MKLNIEEIKSHWTKYNIIVNGRTVSSCSVFKDINFFLPNYVAKKESYNKVVYLDGLKTLDDEQNKGYGTKLINEIISNNEDSIICLIVEPRDYKRLIKFYKKFNFKPIPNNYFNEQVMALCMLRMPNILPPKSNS